ncbi:hypothetical protein QF51_25815 [Salmonella enterica subsp. diarizonae]|nr:hypothetical protein [Salmonella enterica subsp. diarizonae]
MKIWLLLKLKGYLLKKKVCFYSINRSYEVYFDKNILDELKSYGYVGFSFSDEEDIFIMKIKDIKAVESDKLKQRIETSRKRYVCN